MLDRMRNVRRALRLPTPPLTSTTMAALAVALVGLVALTPLGHRALPASPVEAAESVTIGHSVRGRPIEVACTGPAFSEADATALLVGGIHTGGEAITSTLAVELASAAWNGNVDVPSGVRLCILPVLNPDGLASDLHTNANQVDLNRNWPAADWTPDAYHPETGPVSGGNAPLSEPETRALFDYLSHERPSIVLVLHCCGSLVEANSQPLAERLAHRYADTAEYDYLPKWNFYEITGEFIRGMERMRLPAFDIEMTSPNDTDLDRHAAALEAVLHELAEVHGTVGFGTTSPASTVATTGEPPRSVVARLYRVRAGDTLWALAQRFGITTNALAAANNITHPDHFVPGRVMAIPAPTNLAR